MSWALCNLLSFPTLYTVARYLCGAERGEENVASESGEVDRSAKAGDAFHKPVTLMRERMGPPRILLVEDEVLVRMVATDQLEDLGYRVETAGSATEAMIKVKLMEGNIALAIVDIGLPDIKGDVLVGELRTRHPHLPIVVARGYDDPVWRRRFAQDANVSFIRKPYTQNDLRRALPPLHVR